MALTAQPSLLAGRYRVLGRLGFGGMATVFLAEDERLGRRVAVKQLHSQSSEETARRFEREAKLGAALSHPSLVTVFDAVPEEEGVLIVMEYVEGTTLGAELTRGPLEPRRASAIVADVAAALDHAHSHGVVHRDVKPANVLLRTDGAVKLADLGVAKALEGTAITRSGAVLGTPSYMAPEQLSGGEMTPAVDVYALAAVSYEALSGRKARTGKTAVEIAHRMANEPAPDLREAWPLAPPGAAKALARGMARDPKDRPRSAGELARELEAGLTERKAVPPSSGSRWGAGRWAAALAALSAIAGAAALALFAGGDEEPQREPAAREEAPAQADQTERAEAVPEPAGDDPARGAALNEQGFSLLQAGRYDEAVPVLERAVEAFPAGTTDLRYAYALYNLGRSLRLAGRPKEAIPVLERRLAIPNQRETVSRELRLARAAAG